MSASAWAVTGLIFGLPFTVDGLFHYSRWWNQKGGLFGPTMVGIPAALFCIAGANYFSGLWFAIPVAMLFAAIPIITITRICPPKLRAFIERSNPSARHGFERGWLWLDFLGEKPEPGTPTVWELTFQRKR